jgi:hypothetical protein
MTNGEFIDLAREVGIIYTDEYIINGKSKKIKRLTNSQKRILIDFIRKNPEKCTATDILDYFEISKSTYYNWIKSGKYPTEDTVTFDKNIVWTN